MDVKNKLVVTSEKGEGTIYKWGSERYKFSGVR